MYVDSSLWRGLRKQPGPLSLASILLVAASCAEGVAPARDEDASTGTGGFAGSGGIPSGGTSGSVGTGGGATGGGSGTGGASGGTAGAGGSAGASGSAGTGGSAGAGGSVYMGPPPIGDLWVQYRTPIGNASNNHIKPQFKVDNRGTDSVPLSELTIRYWYTVDGSPTGNNYQELTVDYADVTRLFPGTTAVLSFAPVDPAEPDADHYVEVGFSGSGVLGPSQSTNQIETRVNWPGYSPNYDQSNDYSWDPTKTSFADWEKVTLYRRGYLVFGIEPDGTTPTPPPEDGGTADAGPEGGTDGGGAPADAAGD